MSKKQAAKVAFQPFSRRQMEALTWWCDNSPYHMKDAVICDGAVRSGKTMCLSISFISWAFYRFDGMSFALCGKTISSLRRNLVMPLIPVLESLGFVCQLKLSQNLLEIQRDGRGNQFYLFGGRDESSASLIQGMTLAGVLLDEVALMPRSFVEQALARCSVTGSKFWFNCNPEYPHHWFYEEWIQKREQKNVLYLQFRMQDNPSLTPKIIKRYQQMYSGAFYERFVEGKWVAAEGLVYPMFHQKTHVVQPPSQFEEFYISCDYGTVNPASFGLWGLNGGIWYRIREYYHDARREKVQRTDEEYYMELDKLASEYPIQAVIVDPSAASFITCIRKHGKYNVTSANNEVVNGIRRVGDALKAGKLKFSPACEDIIREFSLYRWDQAAQKDAPRKEYDHAMDDMRYFVMGVLGGQDSGYFGMAVER